MPRKVTPEQRQAVLRMLAQDQDRDTIAAAVGVTPGQVSAISAHVKMGTYALPAPTEEKEAVAQEEAGKTENLLRQLSALQSTPRRQGRLAPVWLGVDAETKEDVFWNPDPESGAANPHELVLGESGFGKTYAIACELAELARQNVLSVVFDYGQGFTAATLPEGFVESTKMVELQASREGVDINPLQIFPSDIHGPVNVAQRVADTFARVYPKIGVQQHAVLRQAVLEVMADAGIVQADPNSWPKNLPTFASVHQKLEAYADHPGNGQARYAATVASHISTLFVFNTFRPTGRKLTWAELFDAGGGVCVIQLKGLEYSLERAVTEFLLWNLIGFVEATGPGPLRCFVVLDEAHKLSFDAGSPVEKLLREGRKFGLGLILASQQPEDFSTVAFSNTATKIVFQVGDERSTISRQLHRKNKSGHSFEDINGVIAKLP